MRVVILTALLLASPAAVAEPMPKPVIELDGAKTRTIVKLFERARQAAELGQTEAARISLRAQVAFQMRRAGVESSFGNYVAEALQARNEEWQRSRPADPEREARWARLQELEEEARQSFFSGDRDKAAKLLEECDELREPSRRHGVGAIREALDRTFLSWLINQGDLSKARDYYESTDWKGVSLWPAEMLAKGYAAASRQEEAAEFLLSMRARQEVGGSPDMLLRLGATLAKLGAGDAARGVLREISPTLLRMAALDVRRALPLELARLQLEIADREAAVETLRGIQALEVSVAYEPPAPRPSNIPPNALWFLAWADRDADALALLDRPGADQPVLLVSVMRGQLARGAMSAAWETLQRLKEGDLSMPAPAASVTMHPDGKVTTYTPTSPTRPADAKERRRAVGTATTFIVYMAAQRGSESEFRKAEALAREVDPEWPRSVMIDGRLLKALARSGLADSAIRLAEEQQHPGPRSQGFSIIAEALAGLRAEWEDPLKP